MEQKYSWKKTPDVYYASYYNDIDAREQRMFVVIDNENDQSYLFPRRYIEKEQNGTLLTKREIDTDLWNQDFFNWICSTAPDFCVNIPKEFLTPELVEICLDNSSKSEFLKEVENLTQEQCVRFVKRLPMAIKYVPNEFKTKEMANELLEKIPDLVFYFSKELVSSDLRKKCYDKVSLKDKRKLIVEGYMEDLITSEMLLHLVESGIVFEENLDIDFWSKIPNKIFTEEIAKKIVTACGRCIVIIPKEFQTFEIQKLAIDQGYKNISHIIKDYLRDDTIEYTLNKNGFALSLIPVNRRKKEFCELAVKNNAKALRYVPYEYKTYEMCLDAVTYFPELIEVVPIHILNRQFLSDLEERKVIIPEKYLKYVDECIEIHNKTKGIVNSNQEDELEQAYNEIPSEIRNISINNLSIFFSSPSLEQIAKLGITNLGELFVQSKTIEFIDYFKQSEVFNELINTIGLLRCKYLNEKPLIAINEEKFNGKDEYNFYKIFGLSKRCVTALSRKNFCNSSKEFFLKMQSHNIENELMKTRHLGERGKNEIIAKASIVINYYQSNGKNIINSEKDFDNNEDLKELYKELEELRHESKEINEKIDIVLAKIQEKLLNKSESGGQLLQLNPKKP